MVKTTVFVHGKARTNLPTEFKIFWGVGSSVCFEAVVGLVWSEWADLGLVYREWGDLGLVQKGRGDLGRTLIGLGLKS